MTKITLLTFFILLVSLSFLKSQEYDKKYFRSPVNMKISLSGNFAELRPNHFHSGIDIRTLRVGVKLHAVADGYVSRIRVSAGGYGNALYISHPNGYTSVYAHMHSFKKEISDFVEQEQIKNKKFEFTFYPDSDMFVVKKGEIIGLSGNSGHSFGPHLHFEIRESKDDVPTNPELWGFRIYDTRKPVFKNLKIYDFVTGKSRQISIGKEGYFSLPNTIEVNSKTGFGLEAYDYISNSHSTQGIYSVSMYFDNKKMYSHKMEKFSFYESRYVNSLVDYAEYKNSHKKFMKLYVDSGNFLSIYDKKGGIINLNDLRKHKIKIVLKDERNNTSSMTFFIKAKSLRKPKNVKKNLKFNEDFFLVKEDFRMIIPKNSLYSSINLRYRKTKSTSKMLLSDVHSIHKSTVPVHKYITISIKPKHELSDYEKSKILIVSFGKRNKMSAVDGKPIKNFVSGKVKSFGRYALAIDTVSPRIRAISLKKSKNLTSKKRISFKISDNLSGIKDYFAYIDEKFVIFKYDSKNHQINYYFDKDFERNKNHTIKLIVVDYKNNKTTYKGEFYK